MNKAGRKLIVRLDKRLYIWFFVAGVVVIVIGALRSAIIASKAEFYIIAGETMRSREFLIGLFFLVIALISFIFYFLDERLYHRAKHNISSFRDV